MLPYHFFVTPHTFYKDQNYWCQSRFIYNTEIDSFSESEKDIPNDNLCYSEQLDVVSKEIDQHIWNELYKLKNNEESILLSADENRDSFINEDGSFTKTANSIIKNTLVEAMLNIRKNYPYLQDLQKFIENKNNLNFLCDSILLILQSRIKAEDILIKAGRDGMMEGFVDFRNNMGKVLYKELTDKLLERIEKGETQGYMVFIDLDDFKSVNDRYGHGIGDIALKRSSAAFTKDMGRRDGFIAVRYGGEESGVILSAEDIDEAAQKAEGGRENIENTKIYLVGEENESGEVIFTHITKERFDKLMEEGQLIKEEQRRGLETTVTDPRDLNKKIILVEFSLTASIGVAEIDAFAEGDRIEKSLTSADHQMYTAKHRGGKNCIFMNSKRYTPKHKNTPPNYLGVKHPSAPHIH